MNCRLASPPMAQVTKPAKRPTEASHGTPTEQFVRVRIKALEIPPVKDGIVIGKSAPIGVEAMMRTLKLMSAERFVQLTMASDPVVSHAIVREAVIRKLTEKRLREFISRRVRPLMSENELLMLDMEIEVILEDTL